MPSLSPHISFLPHEPTLMAVLLQVPGRRCPACLSRGQTVWVIPGKYCPQCGTEVL